MPSVTCVVFPGLATTAPSAPRVTTTQGHHLVAAVIACASEAASVSWISSGSLVRKMSASRTQSTTAAASSSMSLCATARATCTPSDRACRANGATPGPACT